MEVSAEADVLLQVDDIFDHVDVLVERHGSAVTVAQRVQIQIGFEIGYVVLAHTVDETFFNVNVIIGATLV